MRLRRKVLVGPKSDQLTDDYCSQYTGKSTWMEETQELSLYRFSNQRKNQSSKLAGTDISKRRGKARKCGILKPKRENHRRIGNTTSNTVDRTHKLKSESVPLNRSEKEGYLQVALRSMGRRPIRSQLL